MANARNRRIGAPWQFESGGSFNNFDLAASNSAVEFIFDVDNDGSGNLTITHVGFRYGARTGTPPTFKISLQGVDGSGLPDGTIKGGASPASATFTPPASTAWDGTWRWIALDNAYVAAPGELLALVIKYDSGTIDASNKSSFTVTGTNLTGPCNFPFTIQNNAGARTPQQEQPVYGFKTASRAYGFPVSATGTIAATSALEVGFALTVDTTFGSTEKIGGIQGLARFPNAGKTIRITLYDTDGTTVLQQVDMDSDIYGNSTGTNMYKRMFDEATLATLTIGNTYYITIYCVDATGNATVAYAEVDSAADWEAHDGGQMYPYVSRTTPGSGAFTTLATRRLLINAIVADLVPPTSGIGSLVGGSLVK